MFFLVGISINWDLNWQSGKVIEFLGNSEGKIVRVFSSNKNLENFQILSKIRDKICKKNCEVLEN